MTSNKWSKHSLILHDEKRDDKGLVVSLLYQLTLANDYILNLTYITWRGVVNKHSISKNHVSWLMYMICFYIPPQKRANCIGYSIFDIGLLWNVNIRLEAGYC
jgi:hypothetical protein